MRISRHSMWMDIAEVASRRSTCMRANNGAVLVSDRNIVSIGYNGPPSGEPHCTGSNCAVNGKCVRSIHAEHNAIRRCPSPFLVGEMDLYCTMSPCSDCTQRIIEHNIRRIFYRYPYRTGLYMGIFRMHNVGVFRVTQSGDLIDEVSGDLCPWDME